MLATGAQWAVALLAAGFLEELLFARLGNPGQTVPGQGAVTLATAWPTTASRNLL